MVEIQNVYPYMQYTTDLLHVTVTDMIQSVIAQAVYLDPNHRQGLEQNRHLGIFWGQFKTAVIILHHFKLVLSELEVSAYSLNLISD